MRSAPDPFRAETPQRSSPYSPGDRPRGLPTNPGEMFRARWRYGKPRAEVGQRKERKGKGSRKTENIQKVKEVREV